MSLRGKSQHTCSTGTWQEQIAKPRISVKVQKRDDCFNLKKRFARYNSSIPFYNFATKLCHQIIKSGEVTRYCDLHILHTGRQHGGANFGALQSSVFAWNPLTGPIWRKSYNFPISHNTWMRQSFIKIHDISLCLKRYLKFGTCKLFHIGTVSPSYIVLAIKESWRKSYNPIFDGTWMRQIFMKIHDISLCLKWYLEFGT